MPPLHPMLLTCASCQRLDTLPTCALAIYTRTQPSRACYPSSLPPQKLKDVADEFERDLHAQKLAEAEARAAEAEALRERIAELEEENAGGCGWAGGTAGGGQWW